MDLHIDAVFRELILPTVERIITDVLFDFRGLCKNGDFFNNIIQFQTFHILHLSTLQSVNWRWHSL